MARQPKYRTCYYFKPFPGSFKARLYFLASDGISFKLSDMFSHPFPTFPLVEGLGQFTSNFWDRNNGDSLYRNRMA